MAIPAIVAAAGLAGAASIAGNWISGNMSAKEAQKNRDFQKDMSDTAHQREMEDMRKAGLNPALSAKTGGASTPSGNVAQVPDYGGVPRDMFSAAQAAAGIKLQESQAKNLDVQSGDTLATQASRIDLNIQNARASLESGKLSAENQKKVKEELQNLIVQRDILRNQSTATSLGLSSAKRESEFFESKLGKAAMHRKHLGKVPGGLSTAKEAYEQYKGDIDKGKQKVKKKLGNSTSPFLRWLLE